MPPRSANASRKTKETDISVSVQVDGSGKSYISTGVGFFDHMLDQLSRHSLIDMTVKANGDLHIDDHHTVEDTGNALGQAVVGNNGANILDGGGGLDALVGLGGNDIYFVDG